MTKLVALATCAAALATALHAADPTQLKTDYEAMQKWQYSTTAVPVSQPLTLTRDTATWTLRSGNVYLMQPISGGRITGMVWQGEGRFAMAVPDPYELAQLRRFADRPQLAAIDEPITELVLRVSDDTIDRLFPNAPKSGPFAKNSIAEKRQNAWLIDLWSDVDARLSKAIANRGLYWAAAFKTASFDWMTFRFNSANDEEVQLIRFLNATPETWLSLDRAEDRTTAGRPGLRESRDATLGHIDVKADLTRYGRTGRIGETEQRTINGHFIVDEELTAVGDGVQALTLDLDATAQNVVARDDKGTPLIVLRDHIGGRSASVDNRLYDATITVLLPKALTNGETRFITFEYDLELPNYALGDTWYPTVNSGSDEYTGKLQLTVNGRNQVRAMGRLADEKESGKTKTSTWLIERPAKMITFATAERFEEVPIEVKGIPTVVSFGWAQGLDVKSRVRNSGADVVNSLQFFQQLLADPIGGEKFFVTSIVGYHGQAFEGFLHLAESSYSEHPGASELFRAHEVAHEWFGHRIGWRTYRDQWLSEALAEYAAMFFVKSMVKGGDKFFEEILQVYELQLKGDLRGAFSKFNRPWLQEMSAAKRKRVGPIGHGYRASTADMPAGYIVQTYVKGPLVIHMLRELFLLRTRSDDLFVKILRDYVREYSGKKATTADFQKIIERNAPGDWSWFFNNWIYRAEIPTVRWSYRVEPAGDKFKIHLTVKRSDVPADFIFMVPVTVEFEGNKSGSFIVSVKEDEQTITREVPMRPRNVVFAPDHSLLANIRKD